MACGERRVERVMREWNHTSEVHAIDSSDIVEVWGLLGEWDYVLHLVLVGGSFKVTPLPIPPTDTCITC